MQLALLYVKHLKNKRMESHKRLTKVGDELPYSITPNADKKAIEQLFSIINVFVHRFIIHRGLFLSE